MVAKVPPAGITTYKGTPSAGDLGSGLHIKTADSGGDVHATGDEFVLENSGDCGMTILSGTSNHGRISFGDSGDNNIGYITYDHGSNAMSVVTNAATAMTIDSIGAVTKPLQPAFNAKHSTTQSNLDINGGSPITIAFGTEIFDQNADFNTTTSTFTAPVTGRYQLNFHTYMADVDDDFAYLQLNLVTSNRQYNLILENSGEDGYDNFAFSTLADMDASDTAYVQIEGSGGADQLDLSQSHFSGYLAC